MRPTKTRAWWKVAAIPALLAGCFTGVFGDDYTPLYCTGDADCGPGRSCLRAKAGSTCVTPEQAACPGGACAEGTTCVAGTCRTVCQGAASLPCLNGQACVGATCISTSDMLGGTGGATGGSAGASAGGAGAGTTAAGGGGNVGGQPAGGSAGGVSCKNDGDCNGGRCCLGGQVPSCQKPCATRLNCASSEVCDILTATSGDKVLVCFEPTGQPEFAACVEDTQCASGLDCKNKLFCSKDCSTNAGCATKYCNEDVHRCSAICVGESATRCAAFGGTCAYANTPGGGLTNLCGPP